MNRRQWIGSVAGGLGVASLGLRRLHGESPDQSRPREECLVVDVKPGHRYWLDVRREDPVPVGTCWQGAVLPRKAARDGVDAGGPKSPLEPMFRKRLIIKVDDVATWSLADFQRFARFIEANNAKADLGIIPGRCGPEVFAWVRSLDPHRFEIWNHTWTHGDGGVPNHYRQPYDVQCRNLERAHRKVLEETGITMRGFCGGGIRFQGQGVHDQDEATHWVVRNHPDYRVHFHAQADFADRGYGQINSDGVFMPWRFSWFENEGLSEKEDLRFVARLRERWPGLDWNRPSAVGNAEELKWRFDHPFWNVPESGQIESTVAQFHPWLWKEPELAALKELLDHVRRKPDWQFTGAFETYKWLRDKQDMILRKTEPARYLLDAKALRFEHGLSLRLPSNTAIRDEVYRVAG